MATDQTIDQLNEYYKLNIQHLSWSFWSSMLALFAGLVALLAGIWLVIRGNISLAGQLSVIGGVLTQFIGAGFFFLYSRNLKQLNVFYEKLIKHKDTLYAITLANEFPEPEKSSALRGVISNLLSRGEPPISSELLKMPGGGADSADRRDAGAGCRMGTHAAALNPACVRRKVHERSQAEARSR